MATITITKTRSVASSGGDGGRSDGAVYGWLLAWYLLFGALHELGHVLAALAAHGRSVLPSPLQDAGAWLSFWLRVLLARQTPLWPGDGAEGAGPAAALVRHAGWVTSLLVAGYLHFHYHRRRRWLVARWAAAVTAVEAVATDLLGLPVIPLLGLPGAGTLLCGNFGIIVLHQAWLAHHGRSALDVLEKMVEVTMMRGAQSGGLVTFDKSGRFQRTRVVNRKRTALSRELRRRLEATVAFGNLPDCTAFSGHTRFATSSKATLEGTHPQQWSPRTVRSVYDAAAGRFASRTVENYVTHNGDFEFYTLSGRTSDLHVVQQFLSLVTGVSTPAVVDSCAVAGMLDVLRTRGCFGLSVRYVLALGMPRSSLTIERFPPQKALEAVAEIFEHVLLEMTKATPFRRIEEEQELRHSYALRVVSRLQARYVELFSRQGLDDYVKSSDDAEQGDSLLSFALKTTDAFLDNDLFFAMKTFMAHAKGSFGLCFTSSLDAADQVCLAARGQTMSVAFYPSKGLICYGSEQAAVKAGISFDFPGRTADALGRSRGEIDNEALRLDLDDLGGEIILLNWSKPRTVDPVSLPNRHLEVYELMNGAVSAVIFKESKGSLRDKVLYHRLTRLSNNQFIRPLEDEPKDLILKDINDIPNALQNIQDDFGAEKASTSLNRLTAFHLSRCLRKRLEARIAGTIPGQSIDILLTGCEVSLWVAEQFASDLKNAFPGLVVKAISSNKLLGSFGQEIAIPTTGFPYSRKTYSLHDSIVIIVSHSGGTFAPLACSNLLQSATRNMFVVTSEWDTQIGKQLRAMDALDEHHNQMFSSRIFSTEIGMRPAEPCSISVAATHQLLTNLLLYVSVVILSEERFRKITKAVISEYDIQILEKCNQMNIQALEDIVGTDRFQEPMDYEHDRAEVALRRAGDLWAEHILENAKAYIMTFIYIFGTVISGYPMFFGIAVAAGLDRYSRFMYLIRVLDAATYFWMPQINITILRIIQGRNIRHRMVGRTVVIGDIPWVSQCAEAFLSKIFAVSYSIAGLNVLSGNPADHFVHRHTHRVVRGSLLICGRPDGRLSALSTAEAAVCLSVNQASSIQSLGGTCESITIGHNPFTLPLTKAAIFLKRKRPLFLCERMLIEGDARAEKKAESSAGSDHAGDIDKANAPAVGHTRESGLLAAVTCHFRRSDTVDVLNLSRSLHDPSIRPRVHKYRSAAALIGAYTSPLEADEEKTEDLSEDKGEEELLLDLVIEEAIREKKFGDKTRKLFATFDVDKDGILKEDEFVEGALKLNTDMNENELRTLFRLYDPDGDGVNYHEFWDLIKDSKIDSELKLPPSNRDERGVIKIEPSREKYFGELVRKLNMDTGDLDFRAARNQHLAQELFESRIASLQRFVAMTVMFHQMGSRVERFFAKISFGLLSYRMDRTHSIMRIATTASPVSGADVKQQMRHLQLLKKVQHSVHIISDAYRRYKTRNGGLKPVEQSNDVPID